MNILIIEDDAAIRQELKLLLENALYQVTVLTEFHHVVEDILQMEPDLILLDVNLPQQSGFEICKSVRKTSDVPEKIADGEQVLVYDPMGHFYAVYQYERETKDYKVRKMFGA